MDRLKPSGRMTAAVIVALFVSTPLLMSRTPQVNDISSPPVSPTSGKALHALDFVGGYFVENRGQVDSAVRYYSRGNPAVAFRDDGVMFVLTKWARADDAAIMRLPPERDRPSGSSELLIPSESLAYMIRFEGSNDVVPTGLKRLPFDSNFFIGNVSSRWRTDVPNYLGILYQNLYDGIDLAYHVKSGRVKYEFILHPGADLASVITRYEGVDDVVLQGGDLAFQTGTGEIRDSAPIAYQGADEVRCAFVLHGHWQVGFDCGSWDRSRELVIDPLVYSTYLGGGGIDDEWSIAINPAGDAYVTGSTTSPDFPATPGTFDTSYNGLRDVFVGKLDSTGSSLLYSTYLGGGDVDFGYSIAVDPADNAYVSGYTFSADFPVAPGAFDTTYNGGQDAFVAKLNPAGASLFYSTYLGGGSRDAGWSIAIDPAGDAYVTGGTSSTDFPVTPGAFDTICNGTYDAFVTKLNPTGGSLIYSTYFGGGGYDEGWSIAVDPASDAYVTGYTNSTDFPIIADALDKTLSGPPDAFVTKLDPTGGSLIYSTYFGGSSRDEGWSIAVDTAGDIYVTGDTNSTDFPVTPSALDKTLDGVWDVFVAKLGPTGGSLLYSTYLGGGSVDLGISIAIDPAGDAYVTGRTWSADFPVTPGTFDATRNGSTDAFMAKLDPTGSSLLYSTYLGGGYVDEGWSIAVDPAGNAYLAGFTSSADFPVTPGAFHASLRGVWDAFVVKLKSPNTPPTITITFPSGGEVWNQGSSHTIIWTASDSEDLSSALRVWINYTSNAGSGSVCGPIAGNVGYCAWTLPTIAATDVVVNGTVIDTGGLKGYGKSGPFTIQALPPVNTPPTVTITSPTGGEEFLKSSTHTITWTMHDDQDINANLTIYINYTTGGVTNRIAAGLKGQTSFAWTLPGIEAIDVAVNITVIDSGGLKGWSQSGPFTIKAPPASVEVNYKPLVAVIFAIILFVAGLWSSKRRPWRGEKSKKAVVKAFMITSLSFIIAEAVIGVVSFLTGELRIPPVVGIGTAVDMAILLIGLGVAILSALRAKPARADAMDEQKSR